jgi:PAS domain S-box-containing protein
MTRRGLVSVQGYLLALVAVFATMGVVLVAYDRTSSMANAKRTTAERVTFQAELAAKEIDRGLNETIAAVAQLAANPGIAALAEPSPDCSLSFSAAGHIDIVRADGAVLCSSSEVLGSHAGADWLTDVGTEAMASGPVVDPTTGEPSLLVSALLPDGGAVATFLELDAVPAQLRDQFGGPLHADFKISPSASTSTDGRIAGDAVLTTIGWHIEASVPESAATQEVDALNRRELLILVTGLLVLGGAAWIVYRGLARPIQRLDAWVRSSMATGEPKPAPTGGPAELVSLAETFEAMTQSVAHELEARVQAEQEARAAAERYRTLFESNPQPMWIHDRRGGTLLDVNRAMVERFGWSRDELRQMNANDLVDADAEVDLIELLRGDEPLERFAPVTLTDRSGEEVDCEISSTVLGLDGTNSRLVIAEDVTNLLRTRRMLRRTDRMESLGHLAGGMAHDFNNSLAAILCYAEFAEEELVLLEANEPGPLTSVLRDVRGISAAGHRAAGLTRQLLSFARGEAAVISSVDLNEVVRDLGDMLVRTLGEQIDLRIALASDLGPMRADRVQLEQVIVNLAVNARDAMPDGGTLSIETSAVDLDEHSTAARPDLEVGPHLRLRVSDTGIGMDLATQEQALEPFFTTKPRSAGTGLGLATVYGIVTRIGGAIQLYSELGHGTSVSVMFPVGEAIAVNEAPEPIVPSIRGRGETVLVIDDDDEIRGVAERILVGAGYDVVTAPSGAHALEIVADRPGEIHLVLSDVVMPGMLGPELVGELRRLQPEIRVVLMSGYAPRMLNAVETLTDGVRLLDKPFSAAALVQRVAEALGRA